MCYSSAALNQRIVSQYPCEQIIKASAQPLSLSRLIVLRKSQNQAETRGPPRTWVRGKKGTRPEFYQQIVASLQCQTGHWTANIQCEPACAAPMNMDPFAIHCLLFWKWSKKRLKAVLVWEVMSKSLWLLCQGFCIYLLFPLCQSQGLALNYRQSIA